MVRIIKEVRPPAFLLENVRGLLTHADGGTWEVVQRELRGCGYVCRDERERERERECVRVCV